MKSKDIKIGKKYLFKTIDQGLEGELKKLNGTVVTATEITGALVIIKETDESPVYLCELYPIIGDWDV